MRLSFKDLRYIVGTPEIAEAMPGLKPLRPFEDRVIDFFSDLSALLRTNRTYSDVATFGFWCRKAALTQEKAKYDDLADRIGKGIVFHSTPGNVPVNFAFSFAAGLLAGNANIVRLPGKDFEQAEVICGAIRELLEGKHRALAPYIVFVKYPPVREISDAFSALCMTRVVWGGDRTVAELRQSPLPPRANEITFADRHSIAVIDADAYLAAERKDDVIRAFWNDTYFTDQNACTSPRIVYWMGAKKREAKEDFWRRVHDTAREKYTLAPVQAVGKLTAAYTAAAAREVRLEKSEDMLVTRMRTEESDEKLMDLKYNSGFFFEQEIGRLEEIAGVCGRRCQTLTYYGVPEETFRAFLEECRPEGVDRIVPMGKSMDFALIWDGHDLIREMSRRVTIT